MTRTTASMIPTDKKVRVDLPALAVMHYLPLLATFGWVLMLVGIEAGAAPALIGMAVGFISHPIVMLRFSAVRAANVFIKVVKNFRPFPTNLAAAAIASLAVLLFTLAVEVFMPAVLTIPAYLANCER